MMSLKKLYRAKDFKSLEKEASSFKLPDLKLDQYIKKLQLLNEHAEKYHVDKDEEQEFILVYRWLTLMSTAQKKYEEFTKEKYPREHNCAIKILTRCEALMNSLKERYKEREANEQNTKLSAKSSPSPAQEKTLKDLTNHQRAGKLDKKTVSSEELYQFLNPKNGFLAKDSCLIIDVRPSKDFSESHLNVQYIINIPEEDVTPQSASAMTKKLPEDMRPLWETRSKVNMLVLMDWSNKESTLQPSAKLFHVREAISKWDPHIRYKSKPLILDGGYEDFLSKYPHFTTNPRVTLPLPKVEIIPSLDSFDYPMSVIEPPEVEKKKPPPLAPTPSSSSSALVNGEMIVDRSSKPKLPESERRIHSKEISDEKVMEEDNLQPPASEESLKTEPISDEKETHESAPQIEAPERKSSASGEPSNPKAMLEELRKVKPDVSFKSSRESLKDSSNPEAKPQKETPKNRTTETTSLEGITRIPLKKEDGPSGSILKRSSSSPNIAKLDDDTPMRIPTFSRSNKPVVYAERADSTYGKTAAGLTGLKNFANNCYMNSILQCLSNTKPLVTELISINRHLAINYQSKTKGKIAQEVVSAFRNMWSGDVRVYSIKDLKSVMGSLKDIFKGSGHQDSNEFLIILLEYLHEDLNIPANVESRLDGAREETGEKAWGEFRRKNCSIIQRLFYGQHRSTVTCTTCGHSSVTFEQFFNLFVPIPSREAVTLNECIHLYMSGEKITGWKCPKCKDERNATKKFDISRLPPILVIALKRFTHEEDSWLQKKENLVSYPLEGLDMDRFTVPGSEQRYKRYSLYAISTHTGTLRSGHYKAICKNYLTEKWYMFDDQSIDPLPEHAVRNIPEAYILFYSAELSNC